VLEFRILGPLEVSDERGPIGLGGPKQRATLALLLLNANRVVSVDRISDELYAGQPPVTAVAQVQRQISDLRKALGASSIETRAPGYVIRVAAGELDLGRFEALTDEAGRALDRGETEAGVDLLRRALALCYGDPLADLASVPFAIPAIQRLEEMRLAALEQRLEAEVKLGRHRELIGELEALVETNPLRERLRATLMVALYRSGRQAEALAVFRAGRTLLVDQLGLEPSSLLRGLERAILTHDPSLEREAPDSAAQEDVRSILTVSGAARSLDALLSIAEPLARGPSRELVVARLVADETDLEPVVSALKGCAASSGVEMRVAAFTTLDVVEDALRLAATCDAELVLIDGDSVLEEGDLSGSARALLERSPADVGVVAGGSVVQGGAGVFVPFGGSEHDWAALELGAWLALGSRLPLRLLGMRADPRRGRRDASRLLADASLAVQRVIGIASAPLLTEAGEDALVSAVDPGSVVVVGLGPRWRDEGVGGTRRALVGRARPPVVLVHRGPRPGVLAPRETRTRFSWSIEAPSGPLAERPEVDRAHAGRDDPAANAP
jgi:DNA-binding SARP family transcriptional activator